MVPRLMPLFLRGESNIRAVRVETVGGVGGVGGAVVGDRYVGQLRVVWAARGVASAPHLQRVRTRVIAGNLGNGRGPEPRHQVRVVTGVVRHPRLVLVGQCRVSKGVRAASVGLRGSQQLAEGGVVGLLITQSTRESVLERNVLGEEEEGDDWVRHTNIEAGSGRDVLEGSRLDRLHLVHGKIAGSLTHLASLILVNDSIVDPSLNVGQSRSSGTIGGTVDVLNNIVDSNGLAGGINHDQVLPVAEIVGDLDFVEGESRNGQGETRVFAKEERQRAEQSTTGKELANRDGVHERGDHADHVLVSLTLGAGDTELVVDVQPPRVKLFNRQIVELELNVRDEVVHDIVDPPKQRLTLDTGAEADSGELGASGSVQGIIGLTGKSKRRAAGSENRSNTDAAKGNFDSGKPIGLDDTSDEPSRSHGTTIEETGHLGKGGQVNKAN